MDSLAEPHLTHRAWARITGGSILLMALIGGLTYGGIHSAIHIPNDPIATSAAVSEHLGLVRVAIAAWTLVAILDLVVSFGVYALYCRTSQIGSLASASLRLIYSAFLVFAITRLIPLTMGHDSSSPLALFEGFETTWSVGLVVFGLHLFGLGILGVKSGFTPNLIGALLILAGLSYLMGESAELAACVLPSTMNLVLSTFMITGELAFALWITGTRPPPENLIGDRQREPIGRFHHRILGSRVESKKQ